MKTNHFRPLPPAIRQEPARKIHATPRRIKMGFFKRLMRMEGILFSLAVALFIWLFGSYAAAMARNQKVDEAMYFGLIIVCMALVAAQLLISNSGRDNHRL